MTTPFPLFRASSEDPFERGRQLGAAAAEYIRGSVEVYEETFKHYTRLSWPEVRELAAGFYEPIAAYDEQIVREMEGLAAGASLTVEDVLAVNARTEIMFGLSVLPPSECTSFYVGPSASADGHVLMGQNWDWRTRTSATTILAEIEQGDRPSFLMLAEAGLVGKLGFNSAGIGVAANALVSDIDRGARAVPFHVVLRGILNSRTLEEAVDAVTRAERAASANYLIATAAGDGVDIETGPGGVEHTFATRPTNDLLAHSNNFTCAIPFGDRSVGDWLDSPERIKTMTSGLERHRGSLDLRTIPELLTDHSTYPNSLCRHPDETQPVVEQSSTVASWIVDLTARTASVCNGPPCSGTFLDVTPDFAVS